MSELAVPKRQKDPDPATEAYLSRVEAELNAQHQELRDQARALLAAVKGHHSVQSEQDWQRIFNQAKINYESGRFLIERLGAKRYLEPELMATLVQLRRGLLAGIENPTSADTMMADSAILAYRTNSRRCKEPDIAKAGRGLPKMGVGDRCTSSSSATGDRTSAASAVFSTALTSTGTGAKAVDTAKHMSP